MEFVNSSVCRRTKRNGKPIWVARCIYLDDEGKRREATKEALTKNDAKDFAKEMERKFKRTHGRELLAQKMTFNQLADYCEKHYYRPAEYKDDRKTSGVRSLATVKANLQTLRQYFGNTHIQKITYGNLHTFRQDRLNHQSNRTGKTLSIASVNRELALLRRFLNIAVSEGWIHKNPFGAGASLISEADEKKREKILSKADEKLLLDACTSERSVTYKRIINGNLKEVTMVDDGEKRKHLKPILICALDTGMRLGEILSLTWQDIDFSNEVINIRAFNTKTAKSRQVPITLRLMNELEKLWSKANGNIDKLVFGVQDNVKRSFDLVRRLAGLDDLRFHDLRHTAATRLIRSGLPIAEVARILGHTQLETTYRYVNANEDTLRRAREAFTNYNEITETSVSESIN